MNKERRAKLAELRDRMSDLQAQVSTLVTDLQDVQTEEQEYLDKMPEGLQEGEKGSKAQCAIDALDNMISELSNFVDLDSGELDIAAE